MGFTIAPLRRQNGQWQINWLPLIGWTLLVNVIMTLAVYSVSRPTPSAQLRHPAAVLVAESTLRSVPADEMNSSTVEVLALGDTVDVLSLSADGWCYVTLPQMPDGRKGTGYIRKQSLVIADSTLAALR
jgi:hypothetical protein